MHSSMTLYLILAMYLYTCTFIDTLIILTCFFALISEQPSSSQGDTTDAVSLPPEDVTDADDPRIEAIREAIRKEYEEEQVRPL